MVKAHLKHSACNYFAVAPKEMKKWQPCRRRKILPAMAERKIEYEKIESIRNLFKEENLSTE